MNFEEYLIIESSMSFRRGGKVNEKPNKPGGYGIKNMDNNNEIFIRYFDGRKIYTGIRSMDIDEFIGEKGPEGGPRKFAGPIPLPKN